jgi:hypothetical protein
MSDSMKLYEYENVSAKDGGVIFQVILSHDISWNIVDGITKFEQYSVNATIHEIDVFPDLNFKKAQATSTYYILSEAVLLKQKLDLLTEYVKKQLVKDYEEQLMSQASNRVENVTDIIIKEATEKYFEGTNFKINIKTNRIVFRGVASSLDSGSPKIVLKASTHMVDTLEGQTIDNWNAVNMTVTGNGANLTISQNSTPKISELAEYDRVDNKFEPSLVELILPSLILKFTGDAVETQKIWSGDEEASANLLDSQIEKLTRKSGLDIDTIEMRKNLE